MNFISICALVIHKQFGIISFCVNSRIAIQHELNKVSPNDIRYTLQRYEDKLYASDDILDNSQWTIVNFISICAHVNQEQFDVISFSVRSRIAKNIKLNRIYHSKAASFQCDSKATSIQMRKAASVEINEFFIKNYRTYVVCKRRYFAQFSTENNEFYSIMFRLNSRKIRFVQFFCAMRDERERSTELSGPKHRETGTFARSKLSLTSLNKQQISKISLFSPLFTRLLRKDYLIYRLDFFIIVQIFSWRVWRAVTYFCAMSGTCAALHQSSVFVRRSFPSHFSAKLSKKSKKTQKVSPCTPYYLKTLIGYGIDSGTIVQVLNGTRSWYKYKSA